jgi:hypothetical protein
MHQWNKKSLGLAGLGLLVALTPLACGDDDDSGDGNTAGKSNGGTSGSGGKSSGGTSGSGGKSNISGSSGLGGESAGSGGAGVSGEGGAGGEGTVAKAMLRVVHASPNAPSVDVYPHGSAVAAAEGLAYGEASELIEVDAGTLSFDLRAAGADPDDAPAFTSADIELAGGAEYTVIAAGDFAEPNDADVGFRLLSLEHDFDATTAGTAVARIVHATSAWSTVDLDIVGSPDVDVPGIDRFGDADNVALPSGATIDIDFQNADGVLSQLILPKLTAGNELFVIATGNPGFPFRAPANGFALLVVNQDGEVSWVKENPWLHVVHASDIGLTDIYASTHAEVMVDDLAANTMKAFQLPASTTGFMLRAVDDAAANGAATALATGATSSLAAGEHYLSYIAGDTIKTIHEQFDLEQPTKVLLRGVHAAKASAIPETLDVGPVVSDALSSTLLVGIAPASSSEDAGIAVNPGNLILGAAATGTTTPLLAQKTLSGAAAPVAGETDFVLVAGTTAAASIWLVNTSVAGWSLR